MSSPPTSADPLLTWRKRFPILENTTYLVSHSLGAMPAAVEEELASYAETWRTRGVRAWSESWWEMPVEVGDLLARLLGAPAGSVSMHLNVTLAQSIFLSSFDWSGPRNRLVCTDLDFPSVLYLYQGLSRRGAEIVRVPSEDGVTIDPERVADAIDDRTAVVAVSHVLFRSGAVLDVAPIVERARRHGARTLLDAYQSVGVLPVDVEVLGVDALTGGSVKWLCGGPGAGYLYVRPSVAERLRPAETGWMAHPEPFAFDPGPMEPTSSAFRYLNGTPAIPALYAARSGYRIVLEVGAGAIRKKSLRLTQRILEGAEERGWTVRTPRDPERRGGTVSLTVPDAERVCASLAERNVLVDARPEIGLRIGPHFYNAEEEVDATLAAIEEILDG